LSALQCGKSIYSCGFGHTLSQQRRIKRAASDLSHSIP
jgi:hypothetical protein